jgi:hypothetical protein
MRLPQQKVKNFQAIQVRQTVIQEHAIRLQCLTYFDGLSARCRMRESIVLLTEQSHTQGAMRLVVIDEQN